MSPSNDVNIMQRGEKLRSLLESDGWKEAKAILDGYIKVVNDITLLNTNANIDDIGKEAYARAKAINLVLSWYNAIENEVEIYKENLYLKAEEKDGQIIRELD